MAKWYGTDEEAETAAKVAALSLKPTHCPRCGDEFDLETLILIADDYEGFLEAGYNCDACVAEGW